MPKYAFECQVCSTRFERTLKMGEHPTYECPSCKEEAPRLFTDFGFAFGAGKGPPANSGVHDHDYPSADKIVGRSAEERWAEYREREKVKKKVREAGGTGALLRVDGEGFVEYDAMTQADKKVRETVVDYAVKMEHQPVVSKPGGQ